MLSYLRRNVTFVLSVAIGPILLLIVVVRPMVARTSAPDVKPAAVARPVGARFRDVALEAGITFQLHYDRSADMDILESIGRGCALLDYDNDGNLDVLLIGKGLALYRGDGHGHFTDVTHETGLDRVHGQFVGCAVGDFNNDGYDDIYLSAYRGGAMLYNVGGKRFEDVTDRLGLKPQPFGNSVAVGDFDGDGRLDLYVTNYLAYDHNSFLAKRAEYTRDGKRPLWPAEIAPETGVLLLNRGDRFIDVTRSWGIAPPTVHGKAMAADAAIMDDSGTQLLFVGDDAGEPQDLLRFHLPSPRGGEGPGVRGLPSPRGGEGSGVRGLPSPRGGEGSGVRGLPSPRGGEGSGVRGNAVNVAAKSGVAFNANGAPYSGMGVDFGDYDNDGRLDMFVTAWKDSPKFLFHNEGNATFADRSVETTIAAATMHRIAWGAKFIDYDNDGWLDIVLANGETDDKPIDFDPSHDSFRQPTQLLHNVSGVAFEDVTASAGPDINRPILGRGLAIGDFDNDGRMDVLIVDNDGRPLLLHNETPNAGHWLLCRLVGTLDNRDGIGALVTFEAGGRKLLRRCSTGGSYLSASDRRVHCGLGAATSADIFVRWPGGRVDRYRAVRADQIVTLVEGSSAPLPGAAGTNFAAAAVRR